MANFTLQAQKPLKGYNVQYGTTSLSELQDTAIYSIALSLQGDESILAIKRTLGLEWAPTGHSSQSDDKRFRLLGLQADQAFVLVQVPDLADGQAAPLPKLADSVYVTDQSDSWVGLQIKGDSAVSALERICPIDLHDTAFAVGQVTRTVMEHLAVIILRESDDHYLLLSPASSAQSFAHMLDTSLHNVVG